jgi:hypothetical protein
MFYDLLSTESIFACNPDPRGTALTPWNQTRIRIEVESWIRILILTEVNEDPQHWFKQKLAKADK